MKCQETGRATGVEKRLIKRLLDKLSKKFYAVAQTMSTILYLWVSRNEGGHRLCP
jgi:hypothetical protein